MSATLSPFLGFYGDELAERAGDQSKLMADVLANFGLMFVEKTETEESGEGSRH